MKALPPVLGITLALTLGVIGGALAYVGGLPLPWMIGPMMATTLAALLHAPIRPPNRLRPVVIPVIGVLLGASVTPDVLGQLSLWAMTFASLPLFLALAGGVSYLTYRRLGRYDPVTAFYAAMPGGLNEMLLLGAAAGGDEKRIALAHAARVLLVVTFVGLFFGLVLGVRSGAGGAGWTGWSELSLREGAILAACAVLGVPMARFARLPAAPVFGPMILSAATHVTGWIAVPPPSALVIAAQITIGTVIGCRFLGATAREILRDLALAIPASLAMLAVAVATALLVTWANGMPLAQVFLAFSPGGLTEMSLLTLTLDQDVAFVSVTHVIRITMVIAAAPFVFRALRGRMGS